MEDKSSEKSRRERRKEARLAKSKKKFDSWVQHQTNKSSLGISSKNVRKLPNDNSKMDGTEQPQMAVSEVNELRKFPASEGHLALRNTRMKKNRTKVSDKTPNTKFFDYLQRDMEGIKMSSVDDLAIERRLAKKLKVKNGTLGAASDDLDNLLEGIPSVLDSIANIENVHRSAEDSSFSGRNDDMNSEDEDLGDEILSEEEDEDIDDEMLSEEEDEDIDDEMLSEEEDEESDSIEDSEQYDDVLDLSSMKKANGKTKKTNPTEHMGSEIKDGKSFAKRGVTMERESAKGVSPVLDSKADKRTHTPADSTRKNLTNSILGKYVAPHLRSHGSNESAEYAQVRSRLRGLLNRLSETNVEGITREISTLFHSVGRSVGCQIITEEIIASCSGGPRGNEQYAAVFAAFVAGMACMVGIDFGAKLLARLAKCFEEEHMIEDNVSLRNLTLLLCYLYVFGLCSSELMYDFLVMLGKRLTEVDVSTVLTVLQCCGMKLRGDDPVGMKNFISSVQCRAAELKNSSRDEKSNITNKRMQFMIETICDIKNNKKRTKEDNVQHTRINKWLQKLRVEDVLIRGLTWSKLLDPGKKGQWWLSGEMSSTNQNIEEFASSIDKEIPETAKMLDLAASQRMNTDARRAIFCVIMSSEDYLDAFEKLLRLALPGKQDREIMRVLVECCLQEKVFNKYYCILASKLCSHDKNHKFTLQYCLWDHFKELDSMQLIRSVHLSKFTAEMVASFSLSLAVLKAVDLNDPIHLSPKRIMHFRMLFEALFELSDKLVWNIFTRIAATPEHEPIRSGIEFFVSRYVVTSNKSLANKFKIARKALRNVEGIVM